MATVARTPDVELLTRLRRRDRTAWEELYAEYQPRLRGFGYRLSGNVHDADDLVQETFVRAVPRLDKLDPQTADVGAYLFTTMRNLYLKQVEREKRDQPVAEVPEPALPTPIEDDPERSTLLGRQQEEVRKANAALQPRQRLVLALRELEDRSYAEIGELVGMKENAVAQLIFRARESLRTELRLLQVDPEQLPEECRRFLPLLAAHLDGQLKGARRDETLAHLESCERCQASLADMREASRRYRTLLLPVAADESRAAIDARLTSAGYWDKGPRRFIVGASTKVALLAVAAVLLGSAGTGVGVALSESEPATVGTTTTQPTTSPTTETGTGERPTTEGSTESTTTTEPTTDAVTTTEQTAPTTDPGQPPTEPEPTVGPPSQPDPPTETTTQPTPTDKTPPTVTITKAPAATTTTAGASIDFTASEKGVTFACKLDTSPFAACSRPVSLSNLAAGAHTFSVRATDKAGNKSKPATVAWTFTPPDTTPPIVTIDKAPPASSPSFAASFSFSANEPVSTFACSLDGNAFAPCTSAVTFQRLSVGLHTFSVRATDLAGNTGQPASHSWTIVIPRPDLTITAFSRFSVTVTNRGNAPAGASVLTISFLGFTFKVPSLAVGGSATFTWTTCRIGTYVAVADQTQVVVESDEKNNTASRIENCRR